MPNYYLSVLYKHIIQVENKNVGLKVGRGAQTYHCPPPPPSRVAHAPLPPLPPLPPHIFIYGYIALDIWLRTILIVRKETRCRHIGFSFRLTTRVLLYASSHRQDNTYTSRGALAGTRNSSMGPPHEGSIRRPIAP